MYCEYMYICTHTILPVYYVIVEIVSQGFDNGYRLCYFRSFFP